MAKQNACIDCPSNRLCFCSGLDLEERNKFAKFVTSRVVVQRSYSLFEVGDSVNSLYFICSGSVKTWNTNIGGEEHVIRFYFPGDIIGLGSINHSMYDYAATTLETTSICEISLSEFKKLATQIPNLNRRLIEAMSWEITHGNHLAQVRGRTRAGSRLAYFLTFLAKKFAKNGYSGKDFALTMKRREIADHLGLTIETVSRTLTQFQKEGLLKVEGKLISIQDRKRLDECSNPEFQATADDGLFSILH